MGINFEVKGMLARLLATEDIIVEHRYVETACFDVKSRVLTLPMWERASNEIYDLLLSHEAAHALYTPTDDWCKDHEIPLSYVNIVEDARIEKLVKRRYGGLSKTFYLGYKEMAEKDFFELSKNDITKYGLADRANLYFKIGNHLQLNFNSEEQSIIDLIAQCETFDDVLEASKILFEYCNKKQNHEEVNSTSLDTIVFGNCTGDTQENSNAGKESTHTEIPKEQLELGGESSTSEATNKENSNIGDNNEVTNSSNKSKSGENSNESRPGSSTGSQVSTTDDVKTVDKLNQAIQKLVSRGLNYNVYVETPTLDIDQIIIPCKEINKVFDSAWKTTDSIMFERTDAQFKEFKQSSQKEVNFLVKEFESKKAANAYSRALTFRTGILDCSKLHTYKFNEDLFKKITTLPDGKNHGLIFILDWSGSMSNVILDTIKQLFNLIWFCKKVSIPFEVYAFTHDYPLRNKKFAYQSKNGLVEIPRTFSLMNFLNSQMNSYTLNNMMKNIFRVAYAYNVGSSYPIPSELRLSGTPLNESIIALQEIIPTFKSKYKLQKVQCIILTDGDASPPKYHIIDSISPYGTHICNGYNQVSSSTFLRNRKTGNTYKFSEDYYKTPSVFLNNLRDMYPDTNFIGFRIICSRDGSYFINRYADNREEYKKYMKQWKDNKSCSIKDTSGYHTYFGIASSSLFQDTSFVVSDTASKRQIKDAFMSSLKNKKTNKKILTEFINLIV